MMNHLREFLIREPHASTEDVFTIEGMIGLEYTDEIITGERPELMFPPFAPRFPE